MSKQEFPHQSFMRNVCCALALLLLSGCSIAPLTSKYDEVTDKNLTTLQQSTDDFIVKLASESNPKARTFQANQNFYSDADKQIRHLEFRVTSIPNNTRTVKLVADVRAVILGSGQCSAQGTSLKDLHCMPSNQTKGPSPAALVIVRRNINQTIGAALALEIAKKQGFESEK